MRGGTSEAVFNIMRKHCVLTAKDVPTRVARKPSSVVDDYLSRRSVAATLKPPVGVMCRANSSPVGVAADGVYMAADVSTRSVSSYLAFPPLP